MTGYYKSRPRVQDFKFRRLTKFKEGWHGIYTILDIDSDGIVKSLVYGFVTVTWPQRPGGKMPVGFQVDNVNMANDTILILATLR